MLARKGDEVIAATDGQDALERIAGHDTDVDLVITDVIMPRLSGPEPVRRLTATRPDLKVLFMSGYTDEGELAVMSDEELTAVLAKPLTPTTLETQVRRTLDQPQRRDETARA